MWKAQNRPLAMPQGCNHFSPSSAWNSPSLQVTGCQQVGMVAGFAVQNGPDCRAIQAVWQRHTARFSNRLWHSGLGTTVQLPSTIPPAQCPPVRLDAACEPLAVASRAKHSPSQAMRAPAFIHYISTITHHRLHTLAVVLHPAMPRHSPQRLRLWRQPAWQAIY